MEGRSSSCVQTLFGLRSEYPADCILRVLDSLLLGVPLPFRQVRDRFQLGVPLLLDLIGDRLPLSLPVVRDLAAPLLLDQVRDRLLLGLPLLLDQVRDRLPLRLPLTCDLLLNRLHPLLVLRHQLLELLRKPRARLVRHGLLLTYGLMISARLMMALHRAGPRGP